MHNNDRYTHANCMNKAWYYLYIECELWRCVWVPDLVTEILPEQCRCTLSNNGHIYVKKKKNVRKTVRRKWEATKQTRILWLPPSWHIVGTEEGNEF